MNIYINILERYTLKIHLGILIIGLCLTFNIFAENKIPVYELQYDEQEEGTDVYRLRMMASDKFLRIDDLSDDSGYILYNDSNRTIYSVNHPEQSILVIRAHDYKMPDSKTKVVVSYKSLDDAPEIAGKKVYRYQLRTMVTPSDVCIDVQLVEGMLPEVTKILHAYQKVMSSQQVQNLPATPEEYRTDCFLYGQVYNEGDYYEKGLPVQEWHSTGKKRLLAGFNEAEVSSDLFHIPENYRQYSIH